MVLQNVAFFEALGNGGMETLRSIILDLIKPYQIPVLLDVKRGDIGTTASAYASCCYDYLQADAVTLSPLMGYDSIEPFITGTFDMHLLFVFPIRVTIQKKERKFKMLFFMKQHDSYTNPLLLFLSY